MMNVDVVECSSGCESGWTLYLEHSYTNRFSDGGFTKASFGENRKEKIETFENQDYYRGDGYLFDEQEEDLSMVSDASSGPPHFDHDIDDEEEVEYNNNNNNNGGRLKKQQCMKAYKLETQCYKNCNTNDFALDDTASSHVFTSNYKDIGGVHVQNNNRSATFERFIDYSSQSYSATPVQVGLLDDGRKSRMQQGMHNGF